MNELEARFTGLSGYVVPALPLRERDNGMDVGTAMRLIRSNLPGKVLEYRTVDS